MSKKTLRWALAAVALAVSIEATAGTTATMPNRVGGQIAITDGLCRDGDSWIAYSRAPNGQTLVACWAYEPSDNMIYVLRGNGELRLYEWSRFTLTAYGQ